MEFRDDPAVLEFRDNIGSVSDVDKEKRQVLVRFPHEVPDAFRTVFLPETFTRGYEERLPTMCWMHNLREPIGAAVSAQSTRGADEIVGEFSNFDAVPLAYRAFSQLEDGHLRDFSFGFKRTGPVKPWANQRGITAFTEAFMQEFSPVTIGSIPGAGMTGLRESPLMEVTREEIDRSFDRGLLSREEARALFAQTLPEEFRSHIDLSLTLPAVPAAPADDVATDPGPEGETETRAEVGPDDGHEVSDGGLCAQATDAALDRAIQLFQSVDVTTLPDDIAQAIQLVYAAGMAIDECLEKFGLDDPDDGDGDDTDTGDRSDEDVETRGMLGTADRDKLPDSDFAYIEPGGSKDDEGKTTPRSLRHFPIQDAAHVRNALARIGAGAEFGDKAEAKVKAAAKAMGIDTGERSDESTETPEPSEPPSTAAYDDAAAILARRLGNG